MKLSQNITNYFLGSITITLNDSREFKIIRVIINYDECPSYAILQLIARQYNKKCGPQVNIDHHSILAL